MINGPNGTVVVYDEVSEVSLTSSDKDIPSFTLERCGTRSQVLIIRLLNIKENHLCVTKLFQKEISS